MVERKPRVAVTLSDEALDLVERLAVLNKEAGAGRYSAAGVVAELIEAQLPMLRQLVELGEQARNLTAEQRQRVSEVAELLEKQVLGSAGNALGSWDDAMTKIKGALS